jgi:glycerophosphoryl diester phosphodiesterase
VTVVIAHRGASAESPENTIAAFERAVAIGADGVELDVRRTADDALVVHHDPYLADGRAVREVVRRELPTSVPSLHDALDACVGLFVNIEIKNSPREPDHDVSQWVADRLGAELERRGGGARWLISSFDRHAVARSRVSAPHARRALLTVRVDEATLASCAAAGHQAIHPNERHVDPHLIRLAHAMGLSVNAWTCNDADRMRQLISWGIDGICTDDPALALTVRAATARR